MNQKSIKGAKIRNGQHVVQLISSGGWRKIAFLGERAYVCANKEQYFLHETKQEILNMIAGEK